MDQYPDVINNATAIGIYVDVSSINIKEDSSKYAAIFEGGNVGIYNRAGDVRSDLIDEILTKIPSEKIIWEAPKKSQQVWFIKLLGANANLGNIAWDEIIPLECLRLGLRGDTFFDYLKNEK